MRLKFKIANKRQFMEDLATGLLVAIILGAAFIQFRTLREVRVERDYWRSLNDGVYYVTFDVDAIEIEVDDLGRFRGQLETLVDQDTRDRRILLVVDSYGGSVNDIVRIMELLEVLKDSGNTFTTYIFNALSGGYIVAMTASSKIYAHPISMVGGQGVLFTHTKISEMFGVEFEYVTQSRYKLTPENLTEQQREMLHSIIDEMNGFFAEKIADARGMRVQYVENVIMNGYIYVGNYAKAIGLVDEIRAFQEARGV